MLDLELVKEAAAKEDLALLKENGCMAITDTKNGVLSLEYEDGEYKAFNESGSEMIGPFMTDKKMQAWIASQYIIEEEELSFS